MALFPNIQKPAPKWYRITNRIWGPVENAILLILLAAGLKDQSLTMIIYKIVSSTARQVLDAVLVEAQNEEPEQPKES